MDNFETKSIFRKKDFCYTLCPKIMHKAINANLFFTLRY